MKTIRAKQLFKNDVIIEKDNRFRVVKIDHNVETDNKQNILTQMR
jgi:hypothetical protein